MHRLRPEKYRGPNSKSSSRCLGSRRSSPRSRSMLCRGQDSGACRDGPEVWRALSRWCASRTGIPARCCAHHPVLRRNADILPILDMTPLVGHHGWIQAISDLVSLTVVERLAVAFVVGRIERPCFPNSRQAPLPNMVKKRPSQQLTFFLTSLSHAEWTRSLALIGASYSSLSSSAYPRRPDLGVEIRINDLLEHMNRSHMSTQSALPARGLLKFRVARVCSPIVFEASRLLGLVRGCGRGHELTLQTGSWNPQSRVQNTNHATLKTTMGKSSNMGWGTKVPAACTTVPQPSNAASTSECEGTVSTFSRKVRDLCPGTR